jgi:hypothetical protein
VARPWAAAKAIVSPATEAASKETVAPPLLASCWVPLVASPRPIGLSLVCSWIAPPPARCT